MASPHRHRRSMRALLTNGQLRPEGRPWRDPRSPGMAWKALEPRSRCGHCCINRGKQRSLLDDLPTRPPGHTAGTRKPRRYQERPGEPCAEQPVAPRPGQLGRGRGQASSTWTTGGKRTFFSCALVTHRQSYTHRYTHTVENNNEGKAWQGTLPQLPVKDVQGSPLQPAQSLFR